MLNDFFLFFRYSIFFRWMLTCVNKECLLSNTNLGGTYEFRTGRREAQSQFDKELNERVREEIMSFARIRLALDRLYLKAVGTRFWLQYKYSWLISKEDVKNIRQYMKFVLDDNSVLTAVWYFHSSIGESLTLFTRFCVLFQRVNRIISLVAFDCDKLT